MSAVAIDAVLALKADAEREYRERLTDFQRTRDAWWREWLADYARRLKSPNAEHSTKLLDELRATFDAAAEQFHHARKMEEVARALPAAIEGDSFAIYFAEQALSRIS